MCPAGRMPSPTLQRELEELGWRLQTATPGDWQGLVPAVLLVDTEADELAALDEAPPWVEVLRSVPSAEVIAARLLRRLSAVDLAERAHRDGLTGLFSRAAMAQRWPGWLGEHGGQGALALALLDLDRFKLINDRFGHSAGDAVLVAVGELLRARMTERDLAFRFGGEEFVWLLARTDDTVLRQEIDDFMSALRAHAFPALGGERVTTSIGLTWLQVDDTMPDAIRRADDALYRAKASGRDVAVIDDSHRPGGVDPEAELRRFMDVTQVYSERLTQMVNALGRRLLQGARREALEDRLTGVANRRYFDERLARECEQARQHGRALALLFIDLDDFGAINRQHGYACGDVVLQRFVMLATAGIRLTDWLARWGGEEFCVVMPDTLPEVAAEVAERLRQSVAGSTLESPDGQRIRLTCSIGVAAFGAGTEPAALAERAGAAARRAKAAGKNKVVVDGAG
jgi:two-component system cell cycle response regulator